MRAPQIGLALLLVSLVACTDEANEVEITQTRVATVQPRQFIPNATSEQRFGGGRRPTTPRAAPDPTLTFALPPGWTKLPPATMRIVNLTVPGGGECYVTQAGGGMLPNANRWYGQIGATPLDAASFAKLPQIKVLGKDAAYIELSGTLQGKPDYMLVGALVENAQGGRPGILSVKMIGSAEALKSQIGPFKAFCASLQQEADPHAGHNHGPGEGHGGGQSAGPTPDLALNWKAPSDWIQGEQRAMREVTFTIGGVECYVSILGGAAGGAEANARRWREQLGQTGPVDVNALPTLDVLGTKAPLVEARGDFKGMAGEQRQGQAMLGVICQLEGKTLFVKMVGPATEVDAQKEKFKAFCRSLEKKGS